MIKEFALQWPLLRQILHGGDGTGPEAMSHRTQTLRPKNDGRGSRPVGLSVLRRRLRSARLSQETVSWFRSKAIPNRRFRADGSARKVRTASNCSRTRTALTKVKYRRPFAKSGRISISTTAMDMIADRVWESARAHVRRTRDGQSLMQTTAIAHLGGATLDNEENYLIKKLFTAGLGMVCISNQARI